MAEIGMPKEIVMRHRPTQFGHIFSGDGYSAGYYSYLWSDTLSADAYEAFVQGKGPYDKDVAKRLRDNVFSVGNSIDAADGYRAFRGKDAGIGALMRHRGFRQWRVIYSVHSDTVTVAEAESKEEAAARSTKVPRKRSETRVKAVRRERRLAG